MTDNNAKTIKELVQIARDGVDFYDKARDEVTEPALKDLFTRMGSAKRALVEALGARLTQSGEEVPDSGTMSGNLRRTYTDMRSAISSKKGAVWVSQLEEVEDRLLEHFNGALQSIEDPGMRETVAAQLPKVRACHDEMRAMKHRMAA